MRAVPPSLHLIGGAIHYNFSMALTRRELAGVLAATAAVASPQAEDEESRSAREALEQNAQQLDKIPLPIATEPACRFKV